MIRLYNTAARAKQEELAAMWSAGELSRAEWKAARDPLQQRIVGIDSQLSQLSGSTALEGVVGNGDELRLRWASLNLERQSAIVRAVLDYAVIAPARGHRFDPERISPVWNL